MVYSVCNCIFQTLEPSSFLVHFLKRMSVLLGKRSRLQEESLDLQERKDKRLRSSYVSSVHDIVELVSNRREDNLRRLSLLFPDMETQELERALADTDNNLEQSIQMLTRLRLDQASAPSPRLYAHQLVSRFQSVTSREEAIELATNAFQAFEQETEQVVVKGLYNQNETLKTALSQLIKDNKLLKKAVLKLKEKLDESSQKEPQYEEQMKEYQQLKMTNYALMLRLQQALGPNSSYEAGKDIF